MMSVDPLDYPVSSPMPMKEALLEERSPPSPGIEPGPSSSCGPSFFSRYKVLFLSLLLGAIALFIVYAIYTHSTKKQQPRDPAEAQPGDTPMMIPQRGVSFSMPSEMSHRELAKTLKRTDIQRIRKMKEMMDRYAPVIRYPAERIASLDAGNRSIMYQALSILKRAETSDTDNTGSSAMDHLILSDAREIASMPATEAKAGMPEARAADAKIVEIIEEEPKPSTSELEDEEEELRI